MVVLRPRIRLPPALAAPLRSLRHHLPPINFLTLHYIYFIGVSLIASIIFWGSSTPSRSVTFTDSIFLTVSAMTLAGLNTINLSELNTFQQFILFLLIMLGSAILVSSAVVHVRKKAFERKFKHVIERERARRKAEKDGRSREKTPSFFSRSRSGTTNLEPQVDGVVVRGRVIHSPNPEDRASSDRTPDHPRSTPLLGREDTHIVDASAAREDTLEDLEAGQSLSQTEREDQNGAALEPNPSSPRIRFSNPTSPFTQRRHKRVFSMSGVGARPDLMNHPRKANLPSYPIPLAALTEAKGEQHLQGTQKYFSSRGFIGRNSQFHSLTIAEREKLGGVEYRAVTMLAVIVPVYFVLWQLLGCIGLGAWVAMNAGDVALQNGLNPWWVGAFNGVSAFNNSGMSLLDANMVAFQTSTYMLITMGLMILAGNTCYPIFLRFILWSLLHLLPSTSVFAEHKRTLRFLLDHPRRCYTTLFPSTHTWWLFGILIILNGIDWIAFEVLNIGNPLITSLDSGPRALDGLFQALAVRSGGFYVVAIAQLRIGLLVLYVVMMYISVYPVVITMRNSNVYEERSLGIYADDPAEGAVKHPLEESFLGGLKRRVTGLAGGGGGESGSGGGGAGKESRAYFVRQQLRGQLAHDLWWIVLAVLFITITETGQFESDPVNYSVFNIIFEVISAYGCVGISVGLPNVAYSFCGGWHVLSKLILCAVMIRGRHRGLPVAIDRAVLLPGEELGVAEEEDAAIRVERVRSRGVSG